MSLTVLHIVRHVLYNFIHTKFELHTNCRHLILINVCTDEFYACADTTNLTEHYFFSDDVWFSLSGYVNS